MSNPEATAEAIESVSNLSFEELVAQRVARQTSPEEEPEEESEESTEVDEEPASLEDEESTESEEEPEEESEEEAEEESEIDLLSLTTEQIQSLAKKGKSRLLQRIGELTAQKKALEEKIQSQPQSQAKVVPQDENPFREVASFEALKGKYDELERTLETTDEILEEHEDYGPDDIIVVGDKEFSKKQIRKANRNAREALTKYIPAQQQHLIKIAQYEEMSKQYSEAAKSEVPEIQDEESEIGKSYKALVSDPLIDRIKAQVPEIGFQIEYILAHAARSLYGNKKVMKQPAMGNKLKVNPSSTPYGAGAAKSSSPAKAKVGDAYSRFEKTGSADEWIAARIAKFK
jgi:hypothetical protein